MVVTADLFGLMQTADDLGFVIRIMAFTYVAYYLFVTFNQNLPIFGLSSLVAGYFMLFHSPVIIVIAVLIVILIFGGIIQQNIYFGVMAPIQQVEQESAMEMQRHAQAAQQKLERGMAYHELSHEEQQAIAMQAGGQPQPVEQPQNQRDAQRRMM